MQITLSDFGRFKVVKLTGEVDLHNSREVKKALFDQIDKEANLVVDFSALDYIDSSGMATLVETFNLSKTRKLEFHISGASGAPLQVLQLTRLDSVFSLVSSLDALQE